MNKRSILVLLGVLVIAFIGLAVFSSLKQTPKPTESPSPPITPVNRADKIPSRAVKVTPEMDLNKPSLHTGLFLEPVQLPKTIDTAGAEDSPFITPDGETLYFFFTPDPGVPAEKQLFDGVTGIWRSQESSDGWSEAEYMNLTTGDLHLDGAATISGNELWFASARKENYRSIDIWIADLVDGKPVNVRNAGERLNKVIGVGELHVSASGDEVFFHSDHTGGKGGTDIWVTRRVNGEWGDPVNLSEINSSDNDGFPYLSQDGTELWFTRPSYGYPAIWMSHKTTQGWSEPRLMVSNFAAEPTLDEEGNLYFCHHFIQNGKMIDADIYYAERIKNPITPIDQLKTPARGFLMGFLPTPNNSTTLDEAYRLAQSSADFVPVWGRPTPYYKLAEDLDGPWGDIFLDDLIRDKGLTPIINVNFMGPNMSLDHPEDMQWVTLNSPFWRNSYREAVLDVVRTVRPRYLSIGNEVNRWYEQYGLEGDFGFRHYLSLYEEIYDAVKELSPETIVFCSFSREIVSQQREADLNVLSLFNQSKLDMLAFTSYPFAVKGIDSPDDLPDDYYTRALAVMPGKLLAFTELGWITHEAFGGEAGQAAFLTQVTGRLTEGADVAFLGWCWLSDLTAADKTGLLSYSGEEKTAWSIWKNVYNRR